jgi:pSer/pThr/pTyr-binding forkhead associated (FHA) protein
MDVKLILFKADGQRKDFPIINPTTVIGRGENCDLRVPLLNVSRRHCELSLGGSVVKIRDLASSNGTYVNNKRVHETLLNPGDRLVVGPIAFTLQIDGQPEDIKPVKTKGQKMAEGEEVVDLEADVIAQPGASALEEEEIDLADVGAEEEEGEIDPIAALEKMAGESKKKKP